MRVAITLDAAAAALDGGDEELAVSSVVEVAQAVADALARGGHAPRIVPLPGDARALFTTAASLPSEADAIFNLAESLRRSSEGEVGAAWLAHLTGLPVTGASPRALSLCLDKALARAVLAAADVPIPRGLAVHAGDGSLEGLSFPRIVKPLSEDASHGIDDGSVVHEPDGAARRVREVVERYGAALVEEYVEGRELQVALLGRAGEAPEILPLGEIDYAAVPRGAPAILTYAAKWDEQSEAYATTPAIAARALTPELERAARSVASRAWSALGLGGYARVDLRVDPARGPVVIDVNPNPDLSPGAGLALAADRAGLNHDDLILRILHLATSASSR